MLFVSDRWVIFAGRYSSFDACCVMCVTGYLLLGVDRSLRSVCCLLLVV